MELQECSVNAQKDGYSRDSDSAAIYRECVPATTTAADTHSPRRHTFVYRRDLSDADSRRRDDGSGDDFWKHAIGFRRYLDPTGDDGPPSFRHRTAFCGRWILSALALPAFRTLHTVSPRSKGSSHNERNRGGSGHVDLWLPACGTGDNAIRQSLDRIHGRTDEIPSFPEGQSRYGRHTGVCNRRTGSALRRILFSWSALFVCAIDTKSPGRRGGVFDPIRSRPPESDDVYVLCDLRPDDVLAPQQNRNAGIFNCRAHDSKFCSLRRGTARRVYRLAVTSPAGHKRQAGAPRYFDNEPGSGDPGEQWSPLRAALRTGRERDER